MDKPEAYRGDPEARQFGVGTGPGPSSRPYRGDYTGGRERQEKERNKGRSAHHDRKYLAQKKHSKGFGFY